MQTGNGGNGIRCKTSGNLLNWEEEGKPIYLGQEQWPWAQGRLTVGFVLDLKNEPKVGKYLMFFHGSRGPKRGETTMNFDIDSHIGLAWSDDLESWHWAEGDSFSPFEGGQGDVIVANINIPLAPFKGGDAYDNIPLAPFEGGDAYDNIPLAPFKGGEGKTHFSKYPLKSVRFRTLTVHFRTLFKT